MTAQRYELCPGARIADPSKNCFVYSFAASSAYDSTSVLGVSHLRSLSHARDSTASSNSLELRPKRLKSGQVQPGQIEGGLAVTAKSARPVIERYLAQNTGVRPSDAWGCDFSLEKCLSRVAQPADLYLFSFSKQSLSRVRLLLDGDGLSVTYSNGNRQHTRLDHLTGLLLGVSSTVKKHLDMCEVVGPGFEPLDCVTFVAKAYAVAVYSSSSRLRYDLLVAGSWLISQQSRILCSLPLSKRKL